jgi:hypothetical protein
VPSSLVFAALVVAWLAVLVPVVARRRQMVPRPAEAHLSSRVLQRPERSGLLSTATATVEAPAETASDDEAGETEHEDIDDTPAVGVEPRGRVLDRGRGRRPVRDDAGEDEGMDDREDEGRTVTLEHDEDLDAYDEGYEHGHDDGYDDRPRPYRPGRGGFDADAAEAAAHARYAFRQRVAVGLIAVAVLSLLAALVVTPVLWWLHAGTDLGLVGYLVFLRRQTRIEDEVRRRRQARASGERRALEARRERQAEHEARIAESDGWGGADELDDDGELGHEAAASESELDDEYDEAEVPSPRWIAPRTPAPEVPDGMELVVDTDEDPDFHDLSDARVPAYRRMAAGA